MNRQPRPRKHRIIAAIALMHALLLLPSCGLVRSMRDKAGLAQSTRRILHLQNSPLLSNELRRAVQFNLRPLDQSTTRVVRVQDVASAALSRLGSSVSRTRTFTNTPEVAAPSGRAWRRIRTAPERMGLFRAGPTDPSDPERNVSPGALGDVRSWPRRLIDRIRF